MKNKQNTYKNSIDFIIVFVYGAFMFILFVNQFFQTQELLNFTIVITIAFIFFILFRIWFYTSVFLRDKDKNALRFLVSFFIEMGQKEELQSYISQYFSGYNKKQIKRVVRKYLEKKKPVLKIGRTLRFNTVFYRKYLGYIMISFNYSNNSNHQKTVLNKYVNILFPSSNMMQQIDYYLFSQSKSGNIKRKQIKAWELY